MDSIPRTSGIYKITCVPTGKVYVGSAIDLQARRSVHLYELRRGTHHSRYLQRAWDKYGEGSFVFEVIELVLSPFLTDREQYWLNKLQSFDPTRGFNLRRIAQSNLGLKKTPEAIERGASKIRGRKREPMSDAQKEQMSTARKGRDLGKWQGRKHRPESIEKMREAKKHTPMPLGIEAAKVKAVSREYIVTSPEGIEQHVKNLNAFCREQGIVRANLQAVVNGKIKSHKGWKCRRADNHPSSLSES